MGQAGTRRNGINSVRNAVRIAEETNTVGPVVDELRSVLNAYDRARTARRRGANPESVAAEQGRYWANHRAERTEKHRKWRTSRPTYDRDYMRHYRATRGDEINARRRANYAAERFNDATQPPVLKLDELTPAQRRVVLALIGPTEQGTLTSH